MNVVGVVVWADPPFRVGQNGNTLPSQGVELSNGEPLFGNPVLISVIISKRSGVMTVRVDDFRPAVDIDRGISRKAAGKSCSPLNRPQIQLRTFEADDSGEILT